MHGTYAIRDDRRARRGLRLPQGAAGARRRRPSGSTRSSTRPGYEGFLHYHDEQDELYFVHSGTRRFEVDGEERVLGPGGLCHVSSTTPRKVSNVGEDDLVLLVVGGKGGYVERDGHLVDEDVDGARRAAFGKQ